MEYIKTELDGVTIIRPKIFRDKRGYFFESFSQKEFESNVFPISFIQDNESCSSINVVRALHFQQPPYDMCKLVRVVSGSVLDVAVDVRKGSPTYGKHFAIELSADNHLMLFIPRGFAHGFVALTSNVIFDYKVDNIYNPQSEVAIKWNDKDLNIDWHIDAEDAVLSDKDKKQIEFKEVESLFNYENYRYNI